MTGNLLGEEFDSFVFSQIRERQLRQAKGFKDTRSIDDLKLLNGRTSFIKLASGVDIFEESIDPNANDYKFVENPTYEDYKASYEAQAIEFNDSDGNPQSFQFIMSGSPPIVVKNYKEKYKKLYEQQKKNRKTQNVEGLNKLKKLGFSGADLKKYRSGSSLAKDAILFGGLAYQQKDDEGFNSPLIFRNGIDTSNELFSKNSYGIGGNEYGKQPMPGVTSVSVNCVNRGSVRFANIQIKAFNTFQFQLIDLLYLRLGFTMMLEWGHSHYSHANEVNEVENTLIEDMWFSDYNYSQTDVLQLIRAKREYYKGNYDAFFGRVVNYGWNFESDGTYTIDLKLVTLGDIVESLTINIPTALDFSGDKPVAINTISEWLDSNKLYANPNEIQRDAGTAPLKGWGGTNGEYNFINLYSYNLKSRDEGENTQIRTIVQKIGLFEFTFEGTADQLGLALNKIRTASRSDEQIRGLNSDLRVKKAVNQEGTEAGTAEKRDALKNISETEIQELKDQVQDRYNDRYRRFDLTEGLNRDNSCFVTFGELLRQLFDSCIPRLEDGSLVLAVGTDEELNIISAQPNQVSFDLSVCFIKPKLYVSGASTPPNLDNQGFKDFFVLNKEGDSNIFYGKLMNIYLNFDFIQSTLDKNIDEEGNLTLYNFLQGICKGINSALGNVNKIEPIINSETNELVFIDQNPIKGNPKILKKLLSYVPPPQEIEPFEIFGFSEDTPNNFKSNFVRDFTLETKISSKLASQISIGTTAGGSASQVTEGTAFSKWNAGLIDRFQKKLLAAPGFLSPEEIQRRSDKAKIAKITKEFKEWWGDVISPYGDEQAIVYGNDRYERGGVAASKEGGTDYLRWSYMTNYSTGIQSAAFGISTNLQAKITFDGGQTFPAAHLANNKDGRYKGYEFSSKTLDAALSGYLIFINNSGRNIVTEQDLKSSYQAWLCLAFGGNIIGRQNTSGEDYYISDADAKYLNISNTTFYKNGKAAFRQYIKLRDQKIYRVTGNPSNQQGFLPIELGLVIDGLSGMKIYNKLNVKTTYLPTQYQVVNQEALSFIITKVDHKIEGNDWITELKTISIPPALAEPTELADNGLFSYLGATEGSNEAYEIRTLNGTGERFPIDELRINADGLEELRKSEGLASGNADRTTFGGAIPNKIYAYKDPGDDAGLPTTIGYGQTFYFPNQKYFRDGVEVTQTGNNTSSRNNNNIVKLGDYITKSSAESGFIQVVASFEDKLKSKGYLKVPMTQNEWNAIVSFSYNTGVGLTNAKKKLVRLINEQDYVAAGYQLEKTIIGTEEKPTLLQSRRTKETNMWFKNNPGNPS